MAKPLKWDRVEDDRRVSRKRVSFGGGVRWLGGGAQSDLPPELAARFVDAERQMRAQGRGPKLNIYVAVLLTITAVGFIVLLAWISPALVGVSIGVLVLAAVVGWLIAPATERRKHEQSIIDTLLAEGHCVGCGYSLRGLVAEQDGCTVCPECRAAWVLPELTPAVSPRPWGGSPIPDPTDRSWHWLDLVIPGRRMVLSYRDARGRILSIIDPTLVRPPAAWLAIDRPTRRRLRIRLWLRGWVWRVLGFAMVCLVMIPQLFRGAGPLYSVLGPLVGAFWIVVSYIWIMTLVLPPRWGRDGIVRMFLRQGICPSCATSIAAVAPEADGKVICPGCRAAWRVEGANGHSPGTV